MLLSGSTRLSDLASLFLGCLSLHVGAVRLERPAGDVQMMVDGDMALLARVMGRGGLQWRCWQNRHCLVVPRHWSRLAGFRDAVLDCPLPVALRASGGSAVIHGPHILNVSLAWQVAEADGIGIQQGYERLAAPMIAALSDMGVPAELSHVPGASCDGRYNLVHGGRKLAGTAGLIRPADGVRGLLLHASMSLGMFAGDLEAISGFERRLGRSADYRLDAHTCLAARTPGQQADAVTATRRSCPPPWPAGRP
ncbi:lipoate--protein ligase family protein [Niveispirillum sp. KHB5.9]|uniref:lipoate--protein ligase family protein n=1 Tax=Niveispirillum sp. KHB5.9 TaxID=3400269 RepID=UPI003A8584F8